MQQRPQQHLGALVLAKVSPRAHGWLLRLCLGGCALLAPGAAQAQPTAAPVSAATPGDPAPSAPAVRPARVEIRTTDGQGTILLDGREVGTGSFDGELEPGRHEVEVRREGYETHVSQLELAPGQVHAETVALGMRATEPEPGSTRTTILSGFYGGLELAAMFMPAGAGSSLETGCDSLGATSCELPEQWGPSLGGYFGYAFDPIGLELYLAALADYIEPTARFDGSYGSELNPLVATPARREEFLIFRVGLLTALRLRATVDLEVVRLAFAGGIGFSYRKLWMRRQGYAEDGTDGESDFVPEPVDYVSPGVTLGAAVGLPLGDVLLSLGLSFWGETASTDARTEADPTGIALVSPSDTAQARPEHTPAYDLASGPQIYLGPVLGLQFGP